MLKPTSTPFSRSSSFFTPSSAKRFFAIFAQGNPDEGFYLDHYDAVTRPFEGWGFVREKTMVVTRSNLDDKLKEAYELGKALN